MNVEMVKESVARALALMELELEEQHEAEFEDPELVRCIRSGWRKWERLCRIEGGQCA